jgi:hypothetical protein
MLAKPKKFQSKSCDGVENSRFVISSVSISRALASLKIGGFPGQFLFTMLLLGYRHG